MRACVNRVFVHCTKVHFNRLVDIVSLEEGVRETRRRGSVTHFITSDNISLILRFLGARRKDSQMRTVGTGVFLHEYPDNKGLFFHPTSPSVSQELSRRSKDLRLRSSGSADQEVVWSSPQTKKTTVLTNIHHQAPWNNISTPTCVLIPTQTHTTRYATETKDWITGFTVSFDMCSDR